MAFFEGSVAAREDALATVAKGGGTLGTLEAGCTLFTAAAAEEGRIATICADASPTFALSAVIFMETSAAFATAPAAEGG